MRKYLRWQLPFADINKTRYVVNIYANEAPEGDPIVFLGAGEGSVFEHTEDTSIDPLKPVRSQTATLLLINDSGSLDFIDEIMPTDNTKRFVQVCALDQTGEPYKVLWQGFLSSDSFSQEYTSRPNAIGITINSLLMAMDSVEAEQHIEQGDGKLSGFATFKEVIEYALVSMADYAGVSDVITDYYIPYSAENILNKVINTYDFFSVEERTAVDSIEHVVKGISLQKVLERICTYMGWTVRERGTRIFFQDPYDDTGKVVNYRLRNGAYLRRSEVSIREVQMSDYIYMGTEHSKSINRGARYVEVIGKMGSVDNIELPECPFSMIERKAFASFKFGDKAKAAALEAVVCRNGEYFDNIVLTHGCKKAELHFQSSYATVENIRNTTAEEVSGNFPNIPDVSFNPDYPTIYGGACFARMEIISDKKWLYHKLQSGIYIATLPTTTYLDPVFRMVTPQAFNMHEGYLHMNINALVGGYCGGSPVFVKTIMDKVGEGVDKSIQMKTNIRMALRWGNYYYNGTAWAPFVYSPVAPWYSHYFNAELEGNNFKLNMEDEKVDATAGLLIPIEGAMSGQIEIVIFPNSDHIGHDNIITMLFISSLDVKYIRPYDHLLNDASENRYMKMTGFAFNETISVNTDITTYKGNLNSPSIVLEPDMQPMEGLLYQTTGQVPRRLIRPEQRLLECMSKFYSAPRASIDLKVKEAQDLAPMVRVIGYDGKTYYPMSEQHDWLLGITTVKMLEVGGYQENTDPDNDDLTPTPSVVPTFPGGGDHTGDGSGGYEDGRDPDDPYNPDAPDWPDYPDWGDQDDDGRDDGPDGDDRDGPDYDY